MWYSGHPYSRQNQDITVRKLMGENCGGRASGKAPYDQLLFFSIHVKQSVPRAVAGDLRQGIRILIVLTGQGVCRCQPCQTAAIGIDLPETVLAEIAPGGLDINQ